MSFFDWPSRHSKDLLILYVTIKLFALRSLRGEAAEESFVRTRTSLASRAKYLFQSLRASHLLANKIICLTSQLRMEPHQQYVLKLLSQLVQQIWNELRR